jgi:hypothetical protein
LAFSRSARRRGAGVLGESSGLGLAGVVVPLDGGDLLAHVGDDEERDVLLGGVGDELAAAVGHLDAVLLLVEREVEGLVHLGHPLGGVLEVDGLGAAEELLDAGLALELDEAAVLGEAALRAEDRQAGLVLELAGALAVASGTGGGGLFELGLGLGDVLADEPLLRVDEAVDEGAELDEPGLVGVRDGAGDDERGPGLVDEDGVHLVHDGVVVAALDELVGVDDERVVAEVVEPELVVRAVGDIGAVGGSALGGVRLVAVDAVHGQAVVLVDRPHPLRVALGEVGVDGDEVDAAPDEGVEVDRGDGDEGLPLARLHFGHAPAVEDDPADELDVVGDHVPGDRGAPGLPRLPDEAAAGILDHGEGLREELLEGVLDGLQPLVLEVVEPLDELLALLEGKGALHGRRRGAVAADGGGGGLDLVGTLEPGAELGPFGVDLGGCLGEALLELGSLPLELVLGEVPEALGVAVDLGDERLERGDVSLVAVAAEELLKDVEHGGCERSGRGGPSGGPGAARA